MHVKIRDGDQGASSMNTILVTGAAGFVGRHLLEALKERYPEARLCLLDHPSSGICGGGHLIETDGSEVHVAADLSCSDDLSMAMDRLVQEVGVPDAVFHLAAQAAVGRSFLAPSSTYEANVVGTSRLLEALVGYTVATRVLIPSSAQVYAVRAARTDAAEDRGSAPAVPLLDETAGIGPATHYGVSKFAQEEVGRLFYESTGLPVFITRAFNHIGPGQGTGFVVPDFARQIAMAEREGAAAAAPAAVAAAEAVTAVGSGLDAADAAVPAGAASIRVGNLDARRDYLDVRDVVAAYLTVIEKGQPGRPYNIASGKTWSAQELLDLLLAEARVAVEVSVDGRLLRPVDVPVLAGDSSRLRALGWEPTHDVKEAARETLDYWRRMTGARIGREA
jgi:GDP-4-dehydro-6-deoxy-D-mannose reductase